MRKIAILVSAILLILIFATSVSAVNVSVGNVALDDDDAVQRSNPLPEGSDNKLDDKDELEYVTFNIPVTASNGTVTVTGVTPDLAGFSYEPFDDEVNSSAEYEIKTVLPIDITNGTTNIVIEVLVASDLDSIDSNFEPLKHQFIATLATSEGNIQSTLSFFAENGLEVDEAIFTTDDTEFTCDPKDAKTDLSCDDEAEEIIPGSDLKMELKIDNKFDEDSDLDFEDVEIDIDTDDSDLDPDDDNEEIDIDADDVGTFTTGFDVDDDIEQGDSFTIEIEVSVIDENGAKHGFLHKVDIDFDLPKGLVEIDDFMVSPSKICAGDDVTVPFVIENKGSDDQNGVRFQIINDQLRVDKVYSGIRLEDAKERKNDNDYSDIYLFSTKTSTRAGSYTIRGTVFFEDEDGDDVSTFEDVAIVIEDCSEPEPTEPNDGGSQNNGGQTIIVTQPSTPSTTPSQDNVTGGTVTGTPATAQPVRAAPAGRDSDVAFVTLLIVLIVVLGLVIGYLVLTLVRRR